MPARNARKDCPGCGKEITDRSKQCWDCMKKEGAPELVSTFAPSWMPPTCERCRGFGFVKRGERDGWSKCPSCRQHPGRTMTHAAWTTKRIEALSG